MVFVIVVFVILVFVSILPSLFLRESTRPLERPPQPFEPRQHRGSFRTSPNSVEMVIPSQISPLLRPTPGGELQGDESLTFILSPIILKSSTLRLLSCRRRATTLPLSETGIPKSGVKSRVKVVARIRKTQSTRDKPLSWAL